MYIALILSCLLLVQASGCTTIINVMQEPGWAGTIKGTVILTDVNGQVLKCDTFAPADTDPGRWIDATTIRADTLHSYITGRPIAVPLSLIRSMETKVENEKVSKATKKVLVLAGFLSLLFFWRPNINIPIGG